jgi:hypothetical protein
MVLSGTISILNNSLALSTTQSHGGVPFFCRSRLGRRSELPQSKSSWLADDVGGNHFDVKFGDTTLTSITLRLLHISY